MKIESIAVRKAQFDDLRVMAQLLAQLFSIENDFEADFEKQYCGLKFLFNDPSATMLVAKHKNSVLGMITMQRLISTAEGGYVGMVEDLIIDADYRSTGIGSLLIKAILKEAHEMGMSRIQLAADMQNTDALEFYKKRGFNPTFLNLYRYVTLV